MTANDKIGLQALEYLRNQGVSVPRDISVVGFDNTREALAADLTSFDFNLPAIVHTMLDHIVNYDGWKRRDRIRREVEGVLIERGSSGGAVTGQ